MLAPFIQPSGFRGVFGVKKMGWITSVLVQIMHWAEIGVAVTARPWFPA
jgi:hypothetical protein